MKAAQLLEVATAHGANFLVDGGRLKVRAPAPLPDELVAALRAHKADLLTLLRAGVGPPVPGTGDGPPLPAATPSQRTHFGLPALTVRCASGTWHVGPTRRWALAEDHEPRLWVCAVCHLPAPGLRVEWR